MLLRFLRLQRVFRVRLEPRRIGAEIAFTGPSEAAPAFADTRLRKERRIREGGKNALADQMAKTADDRFAVRPGQVDGMAGRVGSGGDDDVFQYLWHR